MNNDPNSFDTEEIELISPGIEDRSDLSALYPEVKKNDAPFVGSDEERHRLRELARQDARSQIHRHTFTIAMVIAIPPLLLLSLGVLAAEVLEEKNMAILLPILIAAAMILLTMLYNMYRNIAERLNAHDVTAAPFILTVLLVVVAISPTALWFLQSPLTAPPAAYLGALTAISAMVSLITTKILISLATKRLVAARHKD